MEQTTKKTFKAVIADKLGPAENYSIKKLPLQPLGEGQVRVRIMSASLGYADALLSQGLYQVVPPTPFIPGSEFSGVVDCLGQGVAGLKVGDRVCGNHFGGTLAEYLDVDAVTLSLLPEGMSFHSGACFLVNFQTALYALRQRGLLAKGETLLVLGAAGGVGSAAVKVGKAMGAYVVAGASTQAKREFALALGADAVVDYSKDNWRGELKQLLNGRALDVVYDPVGGKLLDPAFRSISWGGRYLVIGFTGGAIQALPVNLPLLKGASLVGVDIFQFIQKEPDVAEENTQQLWSWVEEKQMVPPVGPVFAFEEFRTALSEACEGKALGKIILQVAE